VDRDGNLLLDQVYPMLQNWLDFAVRADDMHIICVLNAHMAYLHLHTPLHEHTRQSITMLLASQIILNSRHTFNISIPTTMLEPEEKAKAQKEKEDPKKKKKKKKKLAPQKGNSSSFSLISHVNM
jgi:hypothetical protein